MNYHRRDTIAAIATPPGEGGVAIVRISGPKAEAIADRVFSCDVKSLDSHRLHYGHILDIDSALLVVMREGRSYTGELVVEIQGHGGGLVVRRVLEAVLAAGARAALPGEFTFRAFMNGKLDLAQAEAVQALIVAQSDRALDAAHVQLQGRLSSRVQEFQGQLAELAAILEAWVDFPEEGLEFLSMEEFLARLTAVIDAMEGLAKTFDEGHFLQEGIALCLVGAPNVGKSSLMNALLERERAIVTHVPGTTRDTLEESLILEGFHLRLIDTAGLRETAELIEQEGIRRSRKAMADADLTLLVLDASRPLFKEERALIERLERGIVIWNKIDLASPPQIDFPHVVQVSAKTQAGLEELQRAIVDAVWSGPPLRDQVVITHVRHKEALSVAINAAHGVVSGLRSDVSPEFLCLDLRSALTALGRIVGTDVTETILTEIFQRFCIGK